MENFVSGDISVTNGSVKASSFSTPSSGDTNHNKVWTATITPNASVSSVSIDINASVATDEAGNDNTAATQKSVTIDKQAPTQPTIAIHSDNASPSNSVVRPKFTVSGLVLADNGEVTLHKGADCAGNAISTVVDVTTTSHDVTVTSDMSQGPNAIRAKATDEIGNSSCSDAVSYVYDTAAPTVISVAATAGSYKKDEHIDFTVTFGENVTASVTDTTDTDRSYLSIDVGDDADQKAYYQSGSGTTALVYRYTVASGDTDTDGVAMDADVNSGTGTLQDAAGNDATLTVAAKTFSAVLVDTTAPNEPSIARNNPSTATGTDTTPEFRVTNIVSGDTITLHKASECSDTALATVTADATTEDLTSSTLGVGSYTFYAQAEDTAGNTTCSSAGVAYQVLNTFGTLNWTSGYTAGDLTVPNKRAKTDNPTESTNVTSATWTYSSTTASQCSVDSTSGEITAIDDGDCIIKATISKANYESKSINHAAVTIVDGTMSGAPTWSSYSASSVVVGGTVSLSATPSSTNVTPSNGTFSFSSSDENKCTVTSAGVVSGVATGTCTITGTYAKIGYTSLTNPYSLTVVADATPSLSTLGNKTYVTGTAVSLQLPEATGGNDPISYTLTDLLTNWTYTASTRTLAATTGQNNAAFTAKTLTYTATDADGDTDSETFTVTAETDTNPSTVTVADQTATVGVAFTTTLGATSGANDVGAYSLGGTLPAGLNFNAGTRVLSGTPTAATTTPASITYKVVDDNHDSAAVTHTLDTFTITVNKASQTLTAPTDPYGSSPSVQVNSTLVITKAPSSCQASVNYQSTTTSQCTVDLTTGTVTGVAAGTCTIQAKCTDNSNYNATSWVTIEDVVSVIAVPIAPAAPTVTAANQALTVTWTAPSNTNNASITNYDIRYRATDTAPWKTLRVGSSASPFTLLGLTNGFAYDVQVRAVNSVGGGDWSSDATGALTPANSGAPSVVTNFVVKPGNGKLTVSWGAPAESGNAAITGYDLAHDCVSGDNWTAVSVTSSDMTGKDITLSNDIACLLRIRAKNGSDGPYVYASATPKSDAATTGTPDEPRNVRAYERASGSTDYDVIMWEAPYNNGGRAIDHYELQYKKDGDTDWHDFDADGTETTCDGNIDDLENSCTARFTSSINNDDGDLSSDRTNRRFQIRACNTANDTSCSGWIETGAPIKSGPLAMGSTAPTVANSTASGGAGKLTVTYDAPDHNGGSAITEYEVQYVSGSTAGSPPSFGWAAVPSSNTGTCDDSDLTAVNCTHIDKTAAGKYFWYRVRAHNDIGASPWAYVVDTGGKHAYQLPPAPTSVAVAESDTAGQVKVTWILSDTSDAWVAALNDQEVDYLRTADPNSTPSPDNSSWASYSNDTGTSDDCSDTDVDQSTNSSSNPCGMKKASLSGSTGDYLWVRVRSTSVSSATTGDWSDWNTSAVYYEAPPAPSITSISEASDVLTVNWTKSDTSGDLVPDLTDQEVQYARMASSQSSAPTDNGDWQAYTDAVAGDCTADQVLAGTGSCTMKESELDRKTPGNNAKSDKLWVRVRGENGKEGDWAVSSVQTPFVTTPGVPTGVSASSNGAGTSITLSWTSPGDTNGIITGYDVWWKQAASAPAQDDQWEKSPIGCTSLDSSTGCTHTGLTKGLKYWYRVRAKNGVDGTWADSVSETTNSAPSAPSGLTVTKTGYQELSISWSAVTASTGQKAISGYTLQYANETTKPNEEDTKWKSFNSSTPTGEVACSSLNNSEIGCIHSGLVASATYWYRVKSENGISSGWTDLGSVATVPANAPTMPSDFSGNTQTPIITVSNVFDGYNVTLYSDSSCNTTISSESSAVGSGNASINVTTNTLSGLTNGNTQSIYAKATHSSKQDSTCSSALTYTLDTQLPTITITTPSTNSYINVANDSSFTVSGTCSEDGRGVTVDANDSDSSEADFADVTATCGTGNPNWTVNLDLSTSALSEGSITITANHQDAATNNAQATVTATKDTNAPGVVASGVTVTGSNNAKTHKTGETIEFVVTFSEAVTVSGSPELTFNMQNNGGSATDKKAICDDFTAATTMKCYYTVADMDSDDNGINIAANQLGTKGTIQDAAGNAANRDHTAVTQIAHVKIDGTVPSVPRNFAAVATSPANQVALSWIAPATNGGTNITRYEMEYAEPDTGQSPSSWTDANTPHDVSSHECSSLVANDLSCKHQKTVSGKDKHFRIRACNGSADVDCGIWVAMKMQPAGAPANFALSKNVNANAIDLSWGEPASKSTGFTIANYEVQYRASTNSLASDDTGDGAWAKDTADGCHGTNTDTSPCTHTKASVTSYKHFRVRACDSGSTCGAWAYASDLSLVTPKWGTNNEPGTTGSGGVTNLSWTVASYDPGGASSGFDADKQEIEFVDHASNLPNTGWVAVGDTSGSNQGGTVADCTLTNNSTNSCKHTKANSSNKRWFRIRTCDKDGGGSGTDICGPWVVSAAVTLQ